MPTCCMSGISSGAIEPSLGQSPRGLRPKSRSCCSTAWVSCAAASCGQWKRCGKLPARQAALREGRVINQRQDGVEKRRRGQFGLAARLRRAVALQHEAQDLQVDIQHPVLFLLGEIPAFGPQRRQLREELVRRVAAPGEVEPDLQVQHLLHGEIAQAAPHLVPVKGEPALVQQLPVAREGPHEVIPVDLEEILQDREFLLLRQVIRRVCAPTPARDR